MAGPSPSWNTVPLFGTWRNFDGSLKAGAYKVTVNARVTNTTDDAIFPAGVISSGSLNEKEATGGGKTYSLYLDVPASDDPDNAEKLWQLTIEVTFKDSPGEKYTVDPFLSTLNNAPPGINLRKVVLPQTIPVPASVLIRGVPGGLAEYDADGDVIDAAGNKVIGGGGSGAGGPVSSSSITDATTVGKNVLTAADAAAARAALGALPSSYIPTYGSLTGKPATFPPSTHGHTSGDVSDFVEAVQDTVAATLVGGTNVTVGYDDVTGKITLASTAAGGAPTYANLPAGSMLAVIKSGTIWPARPTTRTDVVVCWLGATPAPATVTSGTGGMYEHDIQFVIP